MFQYGQASAPAAKRYVRWKMMGQGELEAVRFFENYGFIVEKIKPSRQGEKTPDFRLSREGQLVAFAEVKSLDKAKYTQGKDPAYNRVSKHIDAAFKQFQAVNADQVVPNVLLIVNDNWTSDYQDLNAVIDGYLPCEEGGRFQGFRKYSQGRIKHRKYDIDLFVWLDLHGSNHLKFNLSRKKNFESLCRWFGVDPRQVEKST